MSIFCALAGHRADRREVYNGGFHFARCMRCGRDMIRSAAGWEAVPAGHRVAWKAGRHSHSLEPDFGRVLPIAIDQPSLPAVRPSFTSWSRQLARIVRRSAVRRDELEAEEVEARESEPFPPLLIIAALVGVGLQLLFGLGSSRRGLA